MMKKNTVWILLGLFVVSSCSVFQPKHTRTEEDVDFSKFNIKKGRLGNIKIGMTLAEAEQYLSGFRKEVNEAVVFGFGGGSPAYLYYWEDEIVLGLIPKLDTDTLLFMIAAHPKLRTENGLNPKSSVGELVRKYPDLMIRQDLMNEWEFFQDERNGWDFIFMTDKETEIGEYTDDDMPAKPKRLDTKADWITIRGAGKYW